MSRQRSERAEQQALLHAWLNRPTYEAMQAQAQALGVSMTRFVQIALPLGAAQLQPRIGAAAPEAGDAQR